MAKRGPKLIRNREAVMMAIYRLVGNELIKGAKNVSQACRSLLSSTHLLGLHFDLSDTSPNIKGKTRMINSDVDIEKLRKWYQEAKELGKDSENYPMLAQTIERINFLVVQAKTGRAEMQATSKRKPGRPPKAVKKAPSGDVAERQTFPSNQLKF